jgi:hypothetical protein
MENISGNFYTFFLLFFKIDTGSNSWPLNAEIADAERENNSYRRNHQPNHPRSLRLSKG